MGEWYAFEILEALVAAGLRVKDRYSSLFDGEFVGEIVGETTWLTVGNAGETVGVALGKLCCCSRFVQKKYERESVRTN